MIFSPKIKLDHKSVVSSHSQLTGTTPYDLSYDFLKLITKSDLRRS